MTDFNIKAKTVEFGTMKGGWASKFPEDTIFLSGAEMDFPTAPVIRNRLAEVALNGLYAFTLPDDRYYNAIIHWMSKVRNIEVKKEWIIPTLGTIFALNTAIRAYTKENDEILIQAPSYYRFDVAMRNNGRKVVYNPMINHHGVYTLDYEDLDKKMQTAKLMVLCNPHNPTGKVFKEDEMTKIIELARKNNVIIFSDEIFGEYQFDSNISIGQYDYDQVIISTSLGKSFNFTGVNHANVIIKDNKLREAYLVFRKIDHFGSLDPFFYNAIIAAYSEEGYEWIKEVKEYIYKQYLLMKEGLKDTPVVVSPLEGSFILWLDFSALGLENEALEKFCLDELKLVGDPGNEYGNAYNSFMRINLATSEENIVRLVEYIKASTRNRMNPISW